MSTRDELVRKVRSIIQTRMRFANGKTNASAHPSFEEMDYMADPKVFCKPTPLQDQSFRQVVFYDQLSKSPEEAARFTEMVTAQVIDDPHCECASSLTYLPFEIAVPDTEIDRYLEASSLPPKMIRRHKAPRPAAAWPISALA